MAEGGALLVTRSRLDALILEQEGLPSLTRRELEALQLQKLNRLLSRERERGGFYRDLPGHLDTLSELSALPFTTDEDLARHAGGLLLTSQGSVQRVLSDATSGTTGAAKRVFYTETDLENTVRLYMAGLGELIYPGSVTMICFPFSGPFGLGELITDAIRRLGARPLRCGPALSYGEFREILETQRPDTFVGMPVQLLSLLRICGRGSLQRALVSGDACPDAVTEACEELLGSALFPHYGSREMGMAGAITCPAHNGMHLRENHVIAEIIDPETGRVLPRGERGELVITTVGMEALPLIRYRTGDFTRILPGTCPCGSETLRLDRVRRGGEEDLISRLDDVLFRLRELADYRISRAPGGYAVRVLSVPRSDAVPAGRLEARLSEKLQAMLPGSHIQLELSPAADTDHSLYQGKRRVLPADC